ncbi:MAG TPA: CvpA family protein [Steroidobacteraceae bacterium]|nr:CvpA family protein [Steroidobacteraceae bacterium]
MVAIDYIIIAIVLVSAVSGLIQGFLREVCALVTWVLAVWLAWKFGPLLEPHLGGALRQAPYGLWAGRGIVFIAVLVVGGIIGAIVNYYVRLSIFSGLDRLLGFVLGLLRGVLIVGVAVVLAQQVKLDGEAWWSKSRLLPHLQPVANMLRALAGEHLPSRPASRD